LTVTRRESTLLLILLGVASMGAWIWFTKSGQAMLTSGENVISSGVQKLADLSDSTLQLIAGFEKFSPVPYRDAGGWSIGYGYFMGPTPTIQNMDEPTAYAYLRDKAQTAADEIKASVQVPLSQNQFDALVSFVYNVGVSAFHNSTLLKKLNAGDFAGAIDEFARWNKSQGQVLAALVSRRNAEASLFANG
jgi:lysozyme